MKLLRLFLSFGWEGEDRIFIDMIEQGIMPEKGAYLDVGAHHPFKASNTALLYMRGWSGINVDIINERLFKWFRRRDKFIYGYVMADVSYYFPNKLFTSDVDVAQDRLGKGWECSVTTGIPNIDPKQFKDYTLLCLDIDGGDYKVLRALMEVYQPPFICAENILEEQRTIDYYLESLNYKKCCQTLHNGIWKKN